jgi:malonate transporter
VIDALAPVALLIALGYALRASGFLPEPSWAPVDRLVYHVLFPSLLVTELATAELKGLPVVTLPLTLR